MAGMATITLDEIERHYPDVLLPPDPEFAEDYATAVQVGRHLAKDRTVALVAICRNAMPWLPRTLALAEQTGAMFREWSCFIYENDSADETKQVLAAWSDGQQRHASLNDNGRPHLNYTTEPVRTHALAEYRTACQTFVRNGERPDYVIVFDTDPFGGWSVDGVATSVAVPPGQTEAPSPAPITSGDPNSVHSCRARWTMRSQAEGTGKEGGTPGEAVKVGAGTGAGTRGSGRGAAQPLRARATMSAMARVRVAMVALRRARAHPSCAPSRLTSRRP
jgi:hypothetical protein